MIVKLWKIVTLTLCILFLVACSSGGGGADTSGSAVGFALPTGIDVLKVDTNSGAAYTDPTTDYSLARQSFHVSHPVGESLNTVSSIMCFLGQLGIGNMWNETTLPRVYMVAVDESKCDSESNQPSEGAAAGGSASSATVLTMVTVRLSREAAGYYPRAEIWFTGSDNGVAEEMRASVDVLQEPSSTNPYGKFNLYFSAVQNGVPKGSGSLAVSGSSAAPISFTFYERFSDGGNTATKGASVEMQTDGSGLKAAIQSQSPWEGNSAWVVATTATSVLANNKNSGNANAGTVGEVNLSGGMCLSKDNYKYRIHGYGLYNENDGSKVSLNTGVSCQYTDSSGVVRNCHVGRQGVWFEQESTGSEHQFANGDTVTRRAWGSDANLDGQTLSLFVSTGRLMKYTVKKYTLSEIRNVEMRMHDNLSNTEFIVKYLTTIDGAVSDGFYKVGTMTWSMGGPPTKTDITPDLVAISNDQWMWFYSDTMGGVSFIGGNAFVTARIEELVVPGAAGFSAGAMSLKCLNRCPKSGITQGDLTTWSGAFETDPANVGAALDYTVKESDMTLRNGTLVSSPEVALSAGTSFSDGTSVFQWGMESGAMVTSTAGLSDLWSIYDNDGNSYYQYRMGPNNWDRLILVKDSSNNFLQFDEPIKFDYTHLTANDRNGDSTFNNKKFLLRYQGEGHIDGFPWDQVDRDGDGTTDMWFPQVSLKDNVQVTSTDGTQYRIKALFGDLTLTTSGANCSGVSLTLPTTSVPTTTLGNPSNMSVSKPDHGSCQFDPPSETASAGCS